MAFQRFEFSKYSVCVTLNIKENEFEFRLRVDNGGGSLHQNAHHLTNFFSGHATVINNEITVRALKNHLGALSPGVNTALSGHLMLGEIGQIMEWMHAILEPEVLRPSSPQPYMC